MSATILVVGAMAGAFGFWQAIGLVYTARQHRYWAARVLVGAWIAALFGALALAALAAFVAGWARERHARHVRGRWEYRLVVVPSPARTAQAYAAGQADARRDAGERAARHFWRVAARWERAAKRAAATASSALVLSLGAAAGGAAWT